MNATTASALANFKKALAANFAKDTAATYAAALATEKAAFNVGATTEQIANTISEVMTASTTKPQTIAEVLAKICDVQERNAAIKALGFEVKYLPVGTADGGIYNRKPVRVCNDYIAY